MTALRYEPLLNGPALPKQPGPGTGGISSNASVTLLDPEALAFAALVRQAQRSLVKDKAYRSTLVGGEVGRFLRHLSWAGKSSHTLDTYEIVLARLAYDHAHFESMEEFTTDVLEDFLQDRWGDCAASTRHNRAGILGSFFAFQVKRRGLPSNPAEDIEKPKRPKSSRRAYPPDEIDQLRDGQPLLRDQICVQLLGRLALRRNELRVLQVWDFDLPRGTVRVQGKGDKTVELPIGFPGLQADLEVHLIGRDGAEYLLYPKSDPLRPMELGSVNKWFKRCLKRAGLPESWVPHEMRHSAADNLWRQKGNLTLAQMLLRHESPATTADYLHPLMDDLASALRSLDQDG